MSEQLQQYVLTQDTGGLFSQLNQNSANSADFSVAADLYLEEIALTLQSGLEENTNIRIFQESMIDRRLREALLPIIEQDKDTQVVCLDRFLLSELESDEAYSDRFSRFSITRAVNGKKVPRQANPPLKDQFIQLKSRINGKRVIIVDDGFFSGGTIRDFLEMSTEEGLEFDVQKVIGFIGTGEPSDDFFRNKSQILEPIINLFDWIDIRDFSPLGGKRYLAGKQNVATSTIPYLYPWSDGASASISMSPQFFEMSEKMIGSFQKLVASYEMILKNRLTFRDLIKAGFPLPTNIENTIPVSINDSVTEYLERCVEIIRNERERNVIICDMDGTLYQIDGDSKGYPGSSLELRVNENALKLIQEREKISKEKAQLILEKALIDPVGISRFLSKRYSISRTEYFESTWNIDPEAIVQNYEAAVGALNYIKICNPSIKLILLTSAPKVWTNRVLKYLRLSDQFEVVYSGEDFEAKEEIFSMISERYRKDRIVSIGDQEETDIKPAREFGIYAVLINQPADWDDLISDIRI